MLGQISQRMFFVNRFIAGKKACTQYCFQFLQMIRGTFHHDAVAAAQYRVWQGDQAVILCTPQDMYHVEFTASQRNDL